MSPKDKKCTHAQGVAEERPDEGALQLTQLTVDRAADYIFWVGADGCIVYANESACRRYGYSQYELIGLGIGEISPRLSGDSWQLRWQEIKQGGVSTIETVHRAKSGELFPVEVAANYVAHLGCEYDIAFARDISERKRAEEKLRLSELSVDRAADLIHWIGRDGRILFANEASCRRDGYSREEMLCLSISDLDPALGPHSWPAIWQRLKDAGSLTLEAVHRTKTGELYPVEISANYVEEGGREYDFVFARDITERKAAEEALRLSEEQLRQSQKMEAIGQLAGGIAHDFNNLLTAIIGYSDLILRSPEGAGESLRGDVQEIKHAADRASDLTRQILAFSRRQALRPEVRSLNEIVAGAERLLGRTLGEHIELVTLLRPDLGLVEVDTSQFEQVLMNLAVNARDAMPAGGKLTVETANVELDPEYCLGHAGTTPGPHVMLAVSDNGVGMDEETRACAFEPFFTTKEQGRGTGLGLSTVHGIVSQSGGSVFLYSEPGKGTAVKVYLPRVGEPKKRQSSTVRAPGSVTGDETILLVEDEKAVRNLAARILERLGYQVVTAASGDEALPLLENPDYLFDMLLTDVVLPGTMQGNELAQAARLLRPSMPVLYMSGYTRDAIVHAGRLDEGVNYLEKPFTPDGLARSLRKVLDCPPSTQ